MSFNPQMLIALAIALSSFLGGWLVNGWRADVRISALEAEYAETLLEAEKTAAAVIEVARKVEARGEALLARQLTLESENLRLGKERDDALRKKTMGRACLGDAALRLLNNPGAASRYGLSASANGAALAPLAATSDTGDIETGYAASDTDVALWAGHAIDQYNACRGRIDALREWYDRHPD
jgi:hypothetical protein